MTTDPPSSPVSISYDRAAGFYDDTRPTALDGLQGVLSFLDGALPTGEVALEIGVGTGALAIPLAGRGRRVIGLDLSEPMLRRLRVKPGADAVRLLLGDATRLPFADGSVGAAYCRWVFHLISAWPAAVAELCRVVRRGGAIAVDPGGYSGEWRVVWQRTIDELGPDARPVGLDIGREAAKLDEAFAIGGGELVTTDVTQVVYEGSLARFFDEAERRVYSWTWRIGDQELERGIAAVRAWAADRYGDLEAPFDPLASHPWRVYRLGSPTDPPNRGPGSALYP